MKVLSECSRQQTEPSNRRYADAEAVKKAYFLYGHSKNYRLLKVEY